VQSIPKYALSPGARALLLLLSLSLAACDKPQQITPQRVPAVSVVTLTAGPLTLTRELPGRMRPYLIAEVRPQVTGIVRERLFTEGAPVARGEALYQLDDATYRAAYNSAKASLERAKASAEVARLNAERAEELIKTNAISKQEFQNLLAARTGAEADVNVANAQLASAAVRLNYARITSPISGLIGKSNVTQGALVTADQSTMLTRVQQLDPMYVDLTQSASEILQLRRELSSSAIKKAEKIPVRILLEDGASYDEEGELLFSDVAVDPMTGSVALSVLVANPDHALLPGMYVRAVISLAVLEDAVLVPQVAVGHDSKGRASVMLVTADDMVEQRNIEVSETIGDKWLLKSGLVAGDRVVVEGLQKIQPGGKVRVTGADSQQQ
jgi:membrane fusion protein (multidrug efflux system)